MFFPKLKHVTCLAHALNIAAEEIKERNPIANDFVYNIKCALSKSNFRKQLYLEKCPGLPYPPTPIQCRWNTWMEAAAFHAVNFSSIKQFITSMGATAAFETNLKRMVRENNIQQLESQLMNVH